MRAVFVPAPESPHHLVHPGLSGVGSVVSWWLGRPTLHSGVVLGGAGAWAIAGGKEAGKSTLLAALARNGYPVLADDLAVVDGGMVMAGPRVISLRLDAAAGNEDALPVVALGAERRARMGLPPAPAVAPLAGVVVLEWGSSSGMTPVSPASRLSRIVEHLAVRLRPSDPGALLDLVAKPMWVLRRERRWSAFDRSLDLAMALVGPPKRA